MTPACPWLGDGLEHAAHHAALHDDVARLEAAAAVRSRADRCEAEGCADPDLIRACHAHLNVLYLDVLYPTFDTARAAMLEQILVSHFPAWETHACPECSAAVAEFDAAVLAMNALRPPQPPAVPAAPLAGARAAPFSEAATCGSCGAEVLADGRPFDPARDVADFMDLFGVPRATAAEMPARGVLRFKLGHLAEELQEISYAMHSRDLAEMADGVADLVYVAIGLALAAGVPFRDLWAEVHAANVRKVRTPSLRESAAKRDFPYEFDVVKPAGWIGPDVARILREGRR